MHGRVVHNGVRELKDRVELLKRFKKDVFKETNKENVWLREWYFICKELLVKRWFG